MKVLLLGATSPIARLLAMRFAADGSSVYLAARDAGEAARIASDMAIRTGAVVLSGPFDAADFVSHASLVARAAEELGGLDGVVLCFGTLGDEDAAQIDPDAALATIHQNFTGAVSI
ncbi:MAG TPA: SDR family NAD(P)-dependent oxidoreductase, partial [Candidatus Binataceae bacterium]|nr:SDR family NAD(P)-dependent oxidoreductase [Candidatus Binataceae bacterium]